MFQYFILGTGATFTFDNSEDQYKNVKTFSQFMNVIIKHNQIPKDVSSGYIKLWKVDLSTRDNNELYLKLEKNPHININVENEYGGVELNRNRLIADEFNLNNTTPEHIHVIIQTTERSEPLKTIKEVIEAITKDVNRRPIKLPNNELEMPLQQRNFEEAMNCINATLYSNIVGQSKSNYWCFVSGGAPGIGKTRFGRELFNQARKDITQFGQRVFNNNPNDQAIFKRLTDIRFEYLLIDFRKEHKLRTCDKDLDATVIIGLRIAYAFFIGKKYNMTFKKFCAKVINICNINIFNFDAVIHECHKSLNLSGQQFFLYLHIDEFQLIDVWDKKNLQNELFHNLIHCISQFMIGHSTTTFIQPFLSGTVPQAVIAQKQVSNISFKFVDCPLLNDASMIRIMDHFAGKFNAKTLNRAYEWKFCRPMLQLLMDTGGLPRTLKRLFITCFGKNGEKGQEFFNNLDIHNFNGFFDKVKCALDSQYNISNDVKKNKKAAMKLMYHCIEGIPIDPDECLDNEKPELTIRSLNNDGYIILSPSTDNLFCINMPFMFICIYNETLCIINPKLTRRAFNVDDCLYWQEWELFVAHHEAFRTNLAIEMGKTDMTLRELYPCADEEDPYFDFSVKLKKLRVCEANEQFPANRNLTNKSDGKPIEWNSGNVVVINGASAQFADIFFVRSSEDDATKFLIMDQCKWDYGSTRLTENQVDEEDAKNLKDIYHETDYDFITIIFTSQPYEKQQMQKPGVLVISKETFNQHFGPVFSTRAIFAITRKVNPNLWEINRLKNILEGIGEKSIEDVIKNRPYINEEQFYKANPRAKKQELELFPFDVPGTEPYAVL